MNCSKSSPTTRWRSRRKRVVVKSVERTGTVTAPRVTPAGELVLETAVVTETLSLPSGTSTVTVGPVSTEFSGPTRSNNCFPVGPARPKAF